MFSGVYLPFWISYFVNSLDFIKLFQKIGVCSDDATPFISKGFQFGLSYRWQELFIDVCSYILLYVLWQMEVLHFHFYFLKRSY